MQPTVDFTIYPAQPLDRPALVELMAALQDTERKLHPNRSPGRNMADAHLAYLEAVVEAQQGQIYVAASAEILGFVVCFVDQLDSGDLHVVEAERTYGYISDLYVLPVARQRGVGVALMRAAEQYFKELNLTVVRVGLLVANAAAAQFYQKAGYRPYEVLYEKRLAG